MDPTYKQLVGARIRQARARLRLPRSQLAERVGVSGAAVSLWEKGGQSPSLPLIPVLARELAVPIGYLLAGQDAPVPLADTLDAVAHSARLAAAAVTGLAADKIEIEIRIKA